MATISILTRRGKYLNEIVFNYHWAYVHTQFSETQKNIRTKLLPIVIFLENITFLEQISADT